MKKKYPIRAFLILLCTVMICTFPVYAAEMRASERIMLSTSTIGKASNGDLSAYFMVRATGEMDVIGATSVEIQRRTITGWVTEYTFEYKEYPELLTTHDMRHSARLTYTPLFPGKSYCAVAHIYVQNETGTSTQKVTSEPVT